MRPFAIALLLVAACGSSEPISPVQWDIQGATISCPGAERFFPGGSIPPTQQVCVWFCVPFQGRSRQTVEAWFESGDGGLSWTFRQVYSSDSSPESCQ